MLIFRTASPCVARLCTKANSFFSAPGSGVVCRRSTEHVVPMRSVISQCSHG